MRNTLLTNEESSEKLCSAKEQLAERLKKRYSGEQALVICLWGIKNFEDDTAALSVIWRRLSKVRLRAIDGSG